MDDTTLRQPFKLIKNKNCIKNGFVPQKVVLHSDGYSFLRSRKSDPLEGVLVSYMNTYTLVTCSVCALQRNMVRGPTCVSVLYPGPSYIPEVPVAWHQSLTAQLLCL